MSKTHVGPLPGQVAFTREVLRPPPAQGFVQLCLAHWRTLVALPAFTFLLVVGVAFLQPRQFAAVSKFKAQSNQVSPLRAAAGLAAQFGFPIGGSTTEEAPEFYTELVSSHEMLRNVATTTYEFKRGQKRMSADLTQLYDVKGPSEEDRIRRTVKRLERDVSASSGLRSGIISIRVKAPSEEIAVQINRRILALLNEFNLERRQSQARSERQFVEVRTDQARLELARAEADLQQFLQTNRQFQSPELTMREGRLQRQIMLRQEVYTSLARSLEQAKVDEVRNTPVITIIDPPETSVSRVSRSLVSRGIVALMLGTIAGAVLILCMEFFAGQLSFSRNTEARNRVAM